jgi:hypothetical protein
VAGLVPVDGRYPASDPLPQIDDRKGRPRLLIIATGGTGPAANSPRNVETLRTAVFYRRCLKGTPSTATELDRGSGVGMDVLVNHGMINVAAIATRMY